MVIEQNSNVNTAESIFQAIESGILRGMYRPDEVLPSIRELAGDLRVSPATVAAAFRKLSERGLTYVVRGVGTKVRRETHIAETLGRGIQPTPQGVVDVASGAPDPSLLPDLNLHLKRIHVATALYNVEPMLPQLRTHASSMMADILQGRPAHVAIANGALEGISDAVDARLRPGDRVIVEDPGFAAAASLLRSHALTLVPVPVDDEGFEPESFAAAIGHGAKAVLYSPRAQNPFGSALTERRSRQLRMVLTSAADRGNPIFVIENDHASLVTDADYHSLTNGADAWSSSRSLSKSHGPDLRFAFVTGDELTMDRIQRKQSLNKGWISTVMQSLVADLLLDPQVQHAALEASALYAFRRSYLIASLKQRGVIGYGISGLNVLVTVQDEGSVSNALLALGWQVRSGQAYRHRGDPFIRLTPASLSKEQIELLAEHVSQVLSSSAPIYR